MSRITQLVLLAAAIALLVAGCASSSKPDARTTASPQAIPPSSVKRDATELYAQGAAPLVTIYLNGTPRIAAIVRNARAKKLTRRGTAKQLARTRVGAQRALAAARGLPVRGYPPLKRTNAQLVTALILQVRAISKIERAQRTNDRRSVKRAHALFKRSVASFKAWSHQIGVAARATGADMTPVARAVRAYLGSRRSTRP